MSDEPKRRGRPPLPPANRRRFNLTFRVRTDLRDRLAAIAEANCRSVSEEVEYRLEASFKDGDIRQIVREEIAAAMTKPKIDMDALRAALQVSPEAIGEIVSRYGYDDCDRDWLRV